MYHVAGGHPAVHLLQAEDHLGSRGPEGEEGDLRPQVEGQARGSHHNYGGIVNEWLYWQSQMYGWEILDKPKANEPFIGRTAKVLVNYLSSLENQQWLADRYLYLYVTHAEVRYPTALEGFKPLKELKTVLVDANEVKKQLERASVTASPIVSGVSAHPLGEHVGHLDHARSREFPLVAVPTVVGDDDAPARVLSLEGLPLAEVVSP